ncbi:MAG: ABC transporter ATP-binding protein [Phycisphaeraceae bacterium]|nr:ABC transporter ATP-binding protein [Phycisphaeraceae bacterium]
MPKPFSSKQRYLEARRQGYPKEDDQPKTGSPQAKPVDKPRRRRYLRQYARWLRPYVPSLLGIFFLSLIGVAVSLSNPILSQRIIDRAVLPADLPFDTRVERLAYYGMGMAILALIGLTVEMTRSYWRSMLDAGLIFRIRQRLFDRMLSLPLTELAEMKTGGIVSRLSGDLDMATNLVEVGLLRPSVATVQAIAGFVIIFIWNWRLATGLAIILPMLMLLHLLYIRRIRPIYRSTREDRSRIDGRVTETFGGIRVVRAFRREPRENVDYAMGHHTVIRKFLHAERLELAVSTGWHLLMPAVLITILWYGGYLVVTGRATVGQLFAFQWYLFQLIEPVLRIVESISQTQRSLSAMERVFDVFEKPIDKPDAPDAVEAPRKVARVQFKGVHFEYRPELPVIQAFDLDVPGGAVVALVGPSGAGKTTITDLLARFYDPTVGVITLNGIDLRRFKLHSYRSLLAVVQQDVFLFDGTVRQNIAYGLRGATDAAILDAAQRANAHVFISQLPESYDTLIGERGVKLSGGQRQRLSIARAILADPQILILDEATSNLDTESEQLIQSALADLYRNRTTFVIAHRLSTITHADLIVVMDQGKIVEIGNHAQLMAAGGMYRDMVERQRQFTPEAASAV